MPGCVILAVVYFSDWPGPRQFIPFMIALVVVLSIAFEVLMVIRDYRDRQWLRGEYGVEIRFGLDTHQRRQVRVINPPPDLAAQVASVLGELSADAQVHVPSAARIEAVFPRQGVQWLRSRMSVALKVISPTETSLEVESKLTDWLGLADEGRNVILIEEFQRRLQRRLEPGATSPLSPTEQAR